MLAYDPVIQTISVHPGYTADVLRLDLIHPDISGNKWFKLKHNLEKAREQTCNTIITFGGAFSNHIAATAAACKLYNLNCIAIIRGEEMQPLNPTLAKAKQNGMQLHFISRELYAQKNSPAFKEQLTALFGPHYLIPEGGNNEAGISGCTHILNPAWHYDYIFCACGTTTTFAGLATSAKPLQSVIGISVLKGEHKLPIEAEVLLHSAFPDRNLKIFGNDSLHTLEAGSHCISNAYCFSGYAKHDAALLDFKTRFEAEHGIPLDYVYTTKLMYAACDLMQSEKLKKGAKVLLIHSGGLQGNAGFEERYHLMPSL